MADVPADLDLSLISSGQMGLVQQMSADPSVSSSRMVALVTMIIPDETLVAEGRSISGTQANVSPVHQSLLDNEGKTGIGKGVEEEKSSMQVEAPELVEEELSSNK